MLTLEEPSSALCVAIGGRLRDLRIQQRLRQQDMADRSGIPLSTYRLMERQGAGSLENFLRAAAVLGATAAFQQLFQPVEEAESLDDLLRRRRRPARVRHAAS
ncbi:helix-turn-helix domain-containing protein [Niveispirillum irakense]|uniref:helix-turn-helix domain-containing protein n=1 Tax=Niveispirillum irakense TaxID=34011 RepID=UPI000415B00A|nr:helix-turn-helix domain-containing protein [Niveispirillum irakense]